MRYIVTGGSGFIGNHLILKLLNFGHEIINIDKLTKVSNRNFKPDSKNYKLFRLDINDAHDIREIFYSFKPQAVFNLAALSHVETSIKHFDDCFHCNVTGTHTLLQITNQYFNELSKHDQNQFRFIQISTDEVYGSLGPNDKPFTELSNYKPNTPYSATKAAGDMLVRSYNKTYGLPTITTHCTNNFGIYQHPEKFIPKCIYKFLRHKPISIYGSGEHIRDWIHVEDHVDGILAAYTRGIVGANYLFGSEIGYSNNFIAKQIFDIIGTLIDLNNHELICHVEDKNHDFRYAVDCSWTKNNLNWAPKHNFISSIKDIIKWYFNNNHWLQTMQSQN